MSQISPPVRILLIGCVVFAAAWFAFLRPGGETPAPPAATAPPTDAAVDSAADGTAATTSAGQAVEAANGAAATADATAAAAAGEATTAQAPTAAAPATGQAAPQAAPAAGERSVKEAGLPLDVAKAFAADDVMVLFFWNPKAADDQQVRSELRRVDRHKGKVFVHTANVDDVARYAPITRGVNLEQSPSVIVVDRDKQGTLFTGFVDSVTIDQAVTDALAK